MSKSKKPSKDKRLLIAKDMPPLKRTQDGQEYDYSSDEVFAWIAQRPGLINYIFDKLSASGYIVYDPNTCRWQGVNFEYDD